MHRAAAVGVLEHLVVKPGAQYDQLIRRGQWRPDPTRYPSIWRRSYTPPDVQTVSKLPSTQRRVVMRQ
jgi:hypothetical protein